MESTGSIRSNRSIAGFWTDGLQIQKYKHSILDGDGSLIGKPVPDADVRILPNVRPPLANFSHDHQTLPKEVVGEICVSGKMVSAGYDRMPGATCDARFKIGNAEFHRMGDLGYFDKTGQLRFLGRKAECVYTGHGPIETERCEPAINQLSCVKKSALVGLGEIPIKNPVLWWNLIEKLSVSKEKILFAKKFSRPAMPCFPIIKSSGYFSKSKFRLMPATMPKFTGLSSPENGQIWFLVNHRWEN